MCFLMKSPFQTTPAKFFEGDHLGVLSWSEIDFGWLALVMLSFLAVYLMGRVRRTLLSHQRVVRELQAEKTKNQGLASLTALAVGAAHEFSTPLATIAVASQDMIHALGKSGDKELFADALLIRNQVTRCHGILADMAVSGQDYLGEAAATIHLGGFVEEAVCESREELARELIIENAGQGLDIFMPVKTLKRTLKELITNGCDSSKRDTPVFVNCSSDKKFVYIEVRDTGAGMSPETIARACEPFFTTKNTGKGFGLGLYLAKTIAERFGGELVLHSELGQGTSAVLKLPRLGA